MKTAEFPAVIEARKVVAHQMAFYRLMMTDEISDIAKDPKKSTPKKLAISVRKKGSKSKETCTA